MPQLEGAKSVIVILLLIQQKEDQLYYISKIRTGSLLLESES